MEFPIFIQIYMLEIQAARVKMLRPCMLFLARVKMLRPCVLFLRWVVSELKFRNLEQLEEQGPLVDSERS